MKTLKSFFPVLLSALFALVTCASLAVVPDVAFADVTRDDAMASRIEGGAYVLDGENLIDQSAEDKLNERAASIASTYNVAPYYVTTSSLEGYSSTSEYARAFGGVYGLEGRASKGCVIMMLSVSQGKYSLVSLGGASEQLTDEVLDYLDSDIFPYLGRSDWTGAAETYFGDVEQTLSGKKANSSTNEPYTQGTYVVDNYGLFNDSQRSELESKAQELASKYKMGVYLLVVDNMGSKNPSSTERTNFATSYYRQHDLGLGSGKDGIMLVIAAGSRDYVTVAYGQGSYSFSDSGISDMEESVTDKLGDNDWFGGAKAYYNSMETQLSYYDANGKTWEPFDPFGFFLKILAILGIPGFAAFVRLGSLRNEMQTAREKSEASDYLDKGSFNLSESTDQYIRTVHTVTPKPKNEDSGGSSFGGGGWGGGGGGGFSSSGGGKF